MVAEWTDAGKVPRSCKCEGHLPYRAGGSPVPGHGQDGPADLGATDVVLVPEFSQLPAMMMMIAQAMCAAPDIDLTKDVDQSLVVPGSIVTYTISVSNTGNVALYDVTVTDPAVPACDKTIGYLAVGATVTYTCTTAVWTPLVNVATATGHDLFGTGVEAEDDAAVALIVEGTGTPGYWKNHPEAWPAFGDIMLVGDWNHNGMCDPAETCLPLTIEQALAAISTPPKGDITYNLARPLITAWINVSSGNDPSCIMDEIQAATEWLTLHPIGSQVNGDDPTWQQAAGWANTLDQYNNGLSCADHRDADNSDADADSTPDASVTPQTTSTTETSSHGNRSDDTHRRGPSPNRQKK